MNEHPLTTRLRLYLFCAILLLVAWRSPEWGLLLAAGFGWWKGCACCGVACSACSASAAETYQIDVSGFTDGTCSTCNEGYNGSFIVTHGVATAFASPCGWGLVLTTNLCDCTGGLGGFCDTIEFDVNRVAGLVDLLVTIYFSGIGGGSARWKESGITPDPDCRAFSSHSVAFLTETTPCNHDGSAALVTAL